METLRLGFSLQFGTSGSNFFALNENERHRQADKSWWERTFPCSLSIPLSRFTSQTKRMPERLLALKPHSTQTWIIAMLREQQAQQIISIFLSLSFCIMSLFGSKEAILWKSYVFIHSLSPVFQYGLTHPCQLFPVTRGTEGYRKFPPKMHTMSRLPANMATSRITDLKG